MLRKLTMLTLLTLTIICAVCSLVAGQALTPPNFNLAVGRKIDATATCGVGVTEAELFCKLTGANPDKEDVIGEFEVIQGQLCDYCDRREPSRTHSPEYAVDGTERWWQSPPLSRGLQFNEVNLTIALGQEFHVAYIFIKMANSPRPGVFALERSKDYGKTWQPWQYFADTPSDCNAFFGTAGYSQSISRDDSVICTTDYSKVVPLEGGEIVISLVNNRPSANNFSYSHSLQDWTRATNVRLRLLRTKTLLGHLMAVARQDPTVTRRYYYSIKDISIGGRCVCYGHADSCDMTDPRDPFKLVCRCQHNTCGVQCETCCPGFVQKPWRPATFDADHVCEPCQCYGHTSECRYDEEVARNGSSIDIQGNYVGGGVCVNCQHFTAGINCDKCQSGYYRPFDVPLNSTRVCQRCRCDTTFSTGNCETGTGRCICRPEFGGINCDRCNVGYYGYPRCIPCQCHVNGTQGQVCEVGGGQCPCKPNYDGFNCDQCAYGYYNFPECKPCECDGIGSMGRHCDVKTGQCRCRPNYGGRNCGQCAAGFYNYPACQQCNCDTNGCAASICNQDNGRCICKENFSGPRCDRCAPGYYRYPLCIPCGCSEVGRQVDDCDNSGQCTCKHNFMGKTCDQCAAGFFRYPDCQSCNCDTYGSYGVNCDQQTGQCNCQPTFDGLTCNKCKPNYYNYPSCEECSCDPAGAKEVPGYPLGGCGSYSDGQLCECKERVGGRICDTCKPGYWNLKIANPDGCEDCGCSVGGAVGWSRACDVNSGQCQCRPFANSRRCDECVDGTYNIQDHNVFGCQSCDCNPGGSQDQNCDKRTGQCNCKPRVNGRRCDSPIATHYFPTLYHDMHELEDGHTPSGGAVRYGFDNRQFPGYSWRGYAIFSKIQDEVLIDVDIRKPSLYRIIYRYINPTGQPITADVTVTPETSSEVQQSSKVVFAPTRQPEFVTVANRGILSTFVLNPGQWTFSLKTSGGVLVDYMVLLPEAYYGAQILQQKVTIPCTVPPTADVCRHYAYVDISILSPSRCSGGFTADRERTQLYTDQRILEQLNVADMALLNRRQTSLTLNVVVPRPGKYVLVVQYFTQVAQKIQELDVSLTSNGGRDRGFLKLPSCGYSSLCRQPVLDANGNPKEFNFETQTATMTISGRADIDVAVESVIAIPISYWTFDYVTPRFVCLRHNGECVPSSFTTPTGTIRVDLESPPNEDRVTTDVPPSIIDTTVRVIKLDRVAPTVSIRATVSNLGKYVIIVKYFQPYIAGFDVDVTFSSMTNTYKGTLKADYCPGVNGCRAVIKFKELPDMQTVDISDRDIRIMFNSTKAIWLDYVMIVASEQFQQSTVLDIQGVDKSNEFITKCGSQDFNINSSVTGFCREAVYSLTTDYNNGALRCQCNPDGSSSFTCEEFGGQCRCKPNVIGRTCSHCRTGYYGFPNCKQCRCPSGLCDARTGQCICPPRVTGPNCDVCLPQTFGFDPLIGCEDCACSPYGVVNNQLDCDVATGQCSCKQFINGRRCDRCEVGYAGFPRCRQCQCERLGSTAEVCDQQMGNCLCKANVEGAQCSQCKPSAFYLEQRNPKGCTQCFCFGITTRCQQSQLRRAQVVDMAQWGVTNLRNPNIQPINNGIEVRVESGDILNQDEAVFWIAPKPYLGNKVTSYGGKLQYTVRFQVPRSGGGDSLVTADVRLEGNNFTIVHTVREQPQAGQQLRVTVDLLESNFAHEGKGSPVSREQFMTVLSRVHVFHIRASYFNVVSRISLSDVRLDIADVTGTGEVASNVEQCECPPNYIGTSCEKCAPGYYRLKQGPYLGTCVPCQCQGRADRCDPESGTCQNCRDNFEGPQCMACKRGYVYDTYTGVCKICSCPLPIDSNNFAYTCDVNPDGSTRTCQCMKGYRGSRCDSCDVGFWGNPLVPGGKCQACQCSGNIDVRDPLSCDMTTGRCVKCTNNAAGDRCERCQDWFHGDAVTLKNCQPCACDQLGSEMCDHQSGACLCRPNVVGYTCNQCAPGAFGFESGRGCELCGCGAASLGSDCDIVTGQCRCRPGVTGRRCDQCERGHWNYGPRGCEPCQCMGDGAVTCDPRTGACQCLPGVTGPNCDRCLPRWVMINGIGCQECDSCVHLLVDDVEILQRNVTTMIRELQSASVGVLAQKRLEEIRRQVAELRPQVDRLTSTPTDPASLEPIKRELASVQRLSDDVSIKSDRMLRESELISGDASDVRVRAEALYEEIVRAAVDAANNAVDFAKKVLTDIRNTIGLTNVDELLRDAERMLSEIKRRDFSQKTHEAQEELARAIEALNRAKELLNKAMEQSNRTTIYIERLTHIRHLLADLKNNSDHSMSNSAKASEMSEWNRRYMQNIVDIVLIIRNTVTEVSRCVDDSRKLIDDARRFLNDARQAYEDINRELSRLDAATERVRIFVVQLTDENIELRPLVDNATEHARKLRLEADRLEGLIANTQKSAEAALNASSSYQSIVDAINKAWNASKEAIRAAEEAISKSTDHTVDAQDSLDRSKELLDKANEISTKLIDDLRPRLSDANNTIIIINEKITEIRTTVQDIVIGLDMLPEEGYGDDAREASRVATEAQQRAVSAETTVQVIVDQLPDDQRKVNQIPRDIDAARRDIRDAQSEVNKVIELVPTAITLLDRLRIQAERIRRLGVDMSANISALRSQVQVARDQANLIRVGVSFDSSSQLRIRTPKNFLAAGSYSKVSMFFRTNERNGLLAYIGPDSGVAIVDYMALEVIDGKVQFKFDLGSGPAIIKSQKDVNDGLWHEVIAERTGKQGTLTIRTQDENNDVQTGSTTGTFSVLDLSYNTKFYVGGVLDAAVAALKPSILTSTRWIGCIEEIKFDGILVGPWNFEEAYNIRGCSDRDKLVDVAPRGLEFGGSGYVILAKGNFRPTNQGAIRFSFRSFATEGLMFLMGQPGKDYLSIELKDGKVLAQYDLGSGSATLLSPIAYNDGKWHAIHLNRVGNDALLKIDGNSAASGRSPGSMKALEIDNEIYFGGFKGRHTYPSVTQKPFKGCIKDVQLGNNGRDLNENLEIKDVLPGCPEVIRTSSFHHSTGGGYISMASSAYMGAAADSTIRQMSMMFKTLEKDGLIFYGTDETRRIDTSPTGQDTSFSVSLSNGKVVLIVVVEGKHSPLESSKDTYNDGRWHYITITRQGKDLYMGIDDGDAFQTRIDGKVQRLIINSPLYFAGLPSNYTVILNNVGSRTNLIGCISDIMINDVPVNFADASPENMKNAILASCHIADPTPSPPPAPTRYTLPIIPIPTGLPPVHCKLPLEPVYEREVPDSDGTRFGIQSNSRYEYRTFPAPYGTDSEFSVDFKTTSTDGIIFYMSHNKHSDFIGLYMKNGQLGYGYNCGTGVARAVSENLYNDGQWHTAVFSRTGKAGTLDIDGGLETIDAESGGRATSVELTAPFFLGGLSEEAATSAAIVNLDGVSSRFVGCLRYLRQSDEEVGPPDYDVGTEPCDQDSEPGTFFYSDGGHLILNDSYSVPLDLEVYVEIKPRTLSGALMSVFSHGSGPPGGDYLVLQLVNGDVVFSMDNGQGEVKAIYSPPAKNELCDGEWHRIKAVKAKNVVTLEVDGIITEPGLGQEGISHTNTLDPLYIGGVPEFHRGIKTRDQYVGCVRNFRLGSETARLTNARTVGHIKLSACPTT